MPSPFDDWTEREKRLLLRAGQAEAQRASLMQALSYLARNNEALAPKIMEFKNRADVAALRVKLEDFITADVYKI